MVPKQGNGAGAEAGCNHPGGRCICIVCIDRVRGFAPGTYIYRKMEERKKEKKKAKELSRLFSSACRVRSMSRPTPAPAVSSSQIVSSQIVHNINHSIINLYTSFRKGTRDQYHHSYIHAVVLDTIFSIIATTTIYTQPLSPTRDIYILRIPIDCCSVRDCDV